METLRIKPEEQIKAMFASLIPIKHRLSLCDSLSPRKRPFLNRAEKAPNRRMNRPPACRTAIVHSV